MLLEGVYILDYPGLNHDAWKGPLYLACYGCGIVANTTFGGYGSAR